MFVIFITFKILDLIYDKHMEEMIINQQKQEPLNEAISTNS